MFKEKGYKDYNKHHKKFYQILGFDIMFDEDFNAWLFEVNSFPSMDIFHHKDTADGTYLKENSEVDEKVKGTILVESARVLLTKQENDCFEEVYDSSEDDSCQLYEDVFAIYKHLSGIKLSPIISISKFAKLAQYLPKSMNVSKIDLELLFKKCQFDDQASMGLITFFSALKSLANKHSMELTDLVDSINIPE